MEKQLKYKIVRKLIQDIIAGNKNSKEFFNESKNYTNKSTVELNNLYNRWVTNNSDFKSYLNDFLNRSIVLFPSEFTTIRAIRASIDLMYAQVESETKFKKSRKFRSFDNIGKHFKKKK